METGKTEGEGEGVKGWLEGTEGDWGGNGNDEGTKEADNDANLGGSWSAGGSNTKKAKSGGKANAKANNKKGKENNGGGDFNAWGTGSARDAKDEKKDLDTGDNGNGNDWNDTSAGGNGNDWNASSGFGDAGGGGGGGGSAW